MVFILCYLEILANSTRQQKEMRFEKKKSRRKRQKQLSFVDENLT